ncbi:hypothetical protein GIB67_012056 [Kingdonia uniflora]|uniref:Amino acid transporter transmembrane domain-containing protein n=1 Tax=Kingdonia uniflora TaxID=39325 RepID=A0A7J7M076_9MAGN|nr:hypothetical protein GIB67_012056 [Kingdonia uniflora]
MNANSIIKTYPDIGEIAFGYKGRVVVSIFMYLELYLVAIQFLILEGDNLDRLFPSMDFEVVGLKIGGKQGFTLLYAFIILPTTWLRMDSVHFHERGRLIDWSGMPTTISLFEFCYCGHAVFPTLCTSMKDKSQFPKVLLVCFVLCTINYGSMAVLGYLMYGEGLKSQVTLNIPLGKLSSKVAIYTTLINPFTKYAIMITPIATAIEDLFLFHTTDPLASSLELYWRLALLSLH